MKPTLENLFMPPKNNWQIFFWPMVIGALSFFGLIGALVDDGWIEDLSNGIFVLILFSILYFYTIKKP